MKYLPPHRWLRKSVVASCIKGTDLPPHRWLRKLRYTPAAGSIDLPPHRWLRKRDCELSN
ncbi:hypothetical protein [uncultured Gammaproteobacteria bacterium]|nr:hypothetical protein [uncultured Gammaproteobacteria bacterium]CAC9963357.1 hypothetical protein [uncultured Gammaproteobacteria bacterium]